ncbi:MAG TPA: sulfur carrier protein ThiS [Polyangiaceae bacterium LLY-WYZ-14_1]|jgi:sulfur carrier protein|nr:sulfur carrier protein ThiS [Polyangiaceae bacterium LLY-WYZ-14_1]
MRIEVNGEPRELPDAATVAELLQELALEGALVAVERNQAIVPRAHHADTRLADGDRVEVVRFVGGG